jgi:hypothetical protein
MPSSISITEFFQIKPFLLAFSIGMLYVYCVSNRPQVIIKYPTPDNAKDFVFRDDSQNCYKFHTEEVKCPKNPLSISTIPIQRQVETFQNKSEIPYSPYNLDSSDEQVESNMI